MTDNKTLINNGDEYYFGGKDFTNMHNFFISKNIEILDGDNCVLKTFKYIYENKIKNNKKMKFQEELNILEKDFKEQSKIPNYNNVIDFLNKTETNYKIVNYTNKNDGHEKIFNPKETLFYFIVYNHHFYLIDKNDNKNLFYKKYSNKEWWDNSYKLTFF